MIKAILMDFNGVIIDDEPIQMRAYAEVLKEDGIDLTEEMYYGCLGMNDETFVRRVAEKAGKAISEDRIGPAIEAKTAKWKEIVDQGIPLFDGVEDFIRRMSNSFEMGVVSMARAPEILYILDLTGLREYFSVVTTAEDVSSSKPDPECYRTGFRMIDRAHSARNGYPITRRRCVVIEDAPQGIQSAKGARLNALGVTNTVSEMELRSAGADAVTHSLRDWNSESFNRVFS